MLQTTRILVPSAMFSILLLGLATIYNGCSMEVQWGQDNLIRVEGSECKQTDEK